MEDYVELKLRFDGSGLAPPLLERDPTLLFWSSTAPRWSKEVKISDIPSTGNAIKCADISVTVPIKNCKGMRRDDAIGMECIVMCPNQDGVYCRVKAGCSFMLMKRILEFLKEEHGTGDNKRVLQLNLLTSPNPEIPLVKGYVEVLSITAGKPNSWDFYSTPYDLIQGDTGDRLEHIVSFNVLRTIYPFNEIASKHGMYAPPYTNEVKRMHAPFWMSEAGGIPAIYFWVDYTMHDREEDFFSNIAKIALDRCKITKEDFLRAVDAQFSDKTSTKVSNGFKRALLATMECIITTAVSMPYIGDFTYARTDDPSVKGTGGGDDDDDEEEDDGEDEDPKTEGRDASEHKELLKWMKVSLESFQDALRMRGGDCEDLARLIHYISQCLEWGKSELSDETKPHTKHGGWTDPVLMRMQRICHIYVACGNLGSVTSKYLGENDDEDEEDKCKKKPPKPDHPIIIDSIEDKRASIGGHMWWEWIPLVKFEELMNRTNKDIPFRLYPTEYRYPWEKILPHLIGEGTGYMSPLMKPHKYYEWNTTKEEQEEAAMDQKKTLACMKILAKDSLALRVAQIKRIQQMVEDVPNSRLSKFYRTTVHAYTDKFIKEGYNIAEFTWFKNLSGGEQWLWGVTMRDKLFDKHNDIGLVATPGYTIKEAYAASSLLRRIPPLENPTRSKTDGTDIKGLCSEYQRKANEITRGRIEGNFNGNINAIFPSYKFFSSGSKEKATKLLEAILKDITKIQSIYRVEFSPEFIHNDCVENICCSLYMKLNIEDVEQQHAKKEEEEDENDNSGGDESGKEVYSADYYDDDT
jgi:hypothetical protein